ncbi:hypothetical protein [Alteromonas sp. ASW11-130]|uniref:hypothetical protein n=1 Tax=Alteromonas sp. ASW11-130 TaxID=3015775 RepID=UPI002241E8EB|nr:hypothetical protein [Alteromonas sp. ASW11-130]MCW8090198.1 hypothetical protein [Alteromonas sp. ASW11-130]
MKYRLENRVDYLKISIASFLIGFVILGVSLSGENYDVFVVSVFGTTVEETVVENLDEVTFYGSKSWRRTYNRVQLDNKYELVSIKNDLSLGSKVLARCFSEDMLCIDELKGMTFMEVILNYDRVSNSKLLIFGFFLSMLSIPVFLILKFLTVSK